MVALDIKLDVRIEGLIPVPETFFSCLFNLKIFLSPFFFFFFLFYFFFPFFSIFSRFLFFSLGPCLQNWVRAYDRRSQDRVLCRVLVYIPSFIKFLLKMLKLWQFESFAIGYFLVSQVGRWKNGWIITKPYSRMRTHEKGPAYQIIAWLTRNWRIYLIFSLLVGR